MTILEHSGIDSFDESTSIEEVKNVFERIMSEFETNCKDNLSASIMFFGFMFNDDRTLRIHDTSVEDILQCYRERFNRAFYSIMQRAKENASDELYQHVAAIHARFNEAYLAVSGMFQCEQGCRNPWSAYGYTDISSLDVDIEVESQPPFLQLLVAMLRELFSGRFRRDGQYVCTEVKGTHFWQKKMTIMDFVRTKCDRMVSIANFQLLNKNANMLEQVTKQLERVIDVQFPDVMKDRHTWSFRNGIWTDGRFVAYDDPEFAGLPDSLVSCKYFEDVDCNPDGGDIPHLRSIMDYQGWDRETQHFFLAFMGRCQYALNERESWQIVPFNIGVANSGKSTVTCQVVKNFYQPEDVGTLSNNIERTFGLGALSSKFLIIGPEIKKDLKLEQAEFQSLVSGESIQVAEKHKPAATVEWDVPAFLAGNELPYQNEDNQGSVTRRIVPFYYENRVTDGDPNLWKKLEAEMGSIIPTCTNAYLDLVEKYGDKYIGNYLPRQIITWRDDISCTLNSIVGFLYSNVLEFGEDLWMPESKLDEEYRAWCRNNGIKARSLRTDRNGFRSQYALRNITHRQGRAEERWTNPRDSHETKDMTGQTILEGVNLNHAV